MAPLRLVLALALSHAVVANAAAQQRPLETHDPQGIGPGRVRLDLGVDLLEDVTFAASGLGGFLLRAPVVGVSVGLGSMVEVQVHGAVLERLAIQRRAEAPLSGGLVIAGDATRDTGAMSVATKIRVLAERASRPAVGLRVATRLPATSDESGLGTDTTDFSASLLLGKTVRGYRVTANLGLSILGDPTDATRQNDVIGYGVSATRLGAPVELVAEAAGRINIRRQRVPPGTESAGQARLGARHRLGAGWLDAALILGITPRDARVGVTAGYTWLFDAFEVP